MKKHKQPIRPTNDSERSPAVHYANWKETIFLQKNLVTINKTERSMLNRITVDQKVMFRRFQRMLTRTKMTQTCVTDEKHVIKQLQGEDRRRLHCESHLVNGEDAEFLHKLKKNPCVFDSAEDKRNFLATQKNARSKSEVTDQELLLLIQTVMKNGNVNGTPDNIRRLSALGSILDAAKNSNHKDTPDNVLSIEQITSLQSKLKVDTDEECLTDVFINTPEKKNIVITPFNFQERPLTTNNTPKQHGPDDNGNRLLVKHDIGSKSLSDVTARNIQCPDVGESISSLTNPNNDRILRETPINYNSNRPMNENKLLSASGNSTDGNNVVVLENKMERMSFDDSIDSVNEIKNHKKISKNAATHKVSINNRPVKAAPRKRMTSIFDEVKRPDLRGMRLQEAKLADYSGQVRDFIEDLSNFGQGVPDFDYYASKMQMDAALQVKPVLPPELPTTPEDVYRKHTGDTTIKCITLPKLKLKMEDRTDKHDSDIFIFPEENLFYDFSDDMSSHSSDDDVACMD